MSDWTSGYIADIGYTFGYYAELQPLRVKLPFLASGIASPGVATACELGFGQGLSANIHAAATGTQWWGTDFNPAQAAFAQELAQVSGAPAHLFDQSFEEFCSRTDLPDFDYIGLHGIWSWISDGNRRVIADFIRRKLKVGGVAYVSYNALPGWAPMIPIRHLLTRHADLLAASGEGIVRRIDGALEFADALLKLNPAYTRGAPVVASRFEKIKTHNRHYLAHEYFNRDWQPMHFLEMAEWMAGAKLGFACSAHYLDHVENLNLTSDQQAFIRDIPDVLFREAVRDFVVNTQFRRDYWVKGPRALTTVERLESLRAQEFLLLTPPEKVVLKVAGTLGEAALNADVYQPLLQALGDHKRATVGDLEARLKVPLAQLLQALMILTSKADVAAVQDETTAARARPYCDRLNRHLMKRARGSSDVSFLASPVTGGGVGVNRFEQLFLLSTQQGRSTPSQIAESLWPLFKSQGLTLSHEGRVLETDEEATSHLQQEAQKFIDERLPQLRELQVA
jgi:hypothetical protein